MDAEAMALQGDRAAAFLRGPGASSQAPPSGDAMADPVVVNFIEYYYKGEPIFAAGGAGGGSSAGFAAATSSRVGSTLQREKHGQRSGDPRRAPP